MKKYLFISALILFASGCATLRDAADIREPQVEFSDVSIQSITFDGVTLLFDFDVTNPNRFNVSAENYNYEFFINGESFITGMQEEPLRIDSESTNRIEVPVTLNFSEVFQSFRSVLQQDSMAYRLATEVEFDLPVAGTRKVPVSTEGEFPIPKMPRVAFGDFNVKQISLSGADVEVSFRVSNPNPFGISVSDVEYLLNVNGREWLDTALDQTIRVDGNENREVIIPIRLNASQLGSALMDLMGGNTTFNYDLSGSAMISAEVGGFDLSEVLPFDLTGQYQMD